MQNNRSHDPLQKILHGFLGRNLQKLKPRLSPMSLSKPTKIVRF